MTEYGLHHTLTKFKEKKFKESLASFLQNIPGINDLITHPVENSTLRSVIEKPPIGGKELLPLTPVQLAGFRLHPGPVGFSNMLLIRLLSLKNDESLDTAH